MARKESDQCRSMGRISQVSPNPMAEWEPSKTPIWLLFSIPLIEEERGKGWGIENWAVCEMISVALIGCFQSRGVAARASEEVSAAISI